MMIYVFLHSRNPSGGPTGHEKDTINMLIGVAKVTPEKNFKRTYLYAEK